MDKNMIHIDDFVRQRFIGREEKERPGAWLQMRELLDKNMPVNSTPAFNWRRFSGLVAGLLLLSGLTVGGYKLAHNNVETSSATDTHAPSALASNHNDASQNGYPIEGVAITSDNSEKSNNKKHVKTHQNATIKNTVASNKTTANTAKGNTEARTNNDHKTITANTHAVKKVLHATNKTTEDNKTSVAKKQSGNTTIEKSANNQQTDLVVKNSEEQKPVQQPLDNQQAKNKTTNQQAIAPVLASANNKPANRNENILSASVSRENKTPENIAVKKDTIEIEKINLVTRTTINPYTHKRQTHLDTEAIEKTLVERRLPVNTPNVVASSKKLSTTTASSTNTADAGDQMVLLANYKVASKKNKGWDPQKFEDMFERAKFNLSQTKFYPGVTLGYQSTFVNGLMHGFFLGLNNHIVFNEHWSVMTELKYVMRFNNGATVRDSYDTTRSSLTVYAANPPYHVIGNVYSRDSIANHFNFSTSSAMSLPVTVRYAVNRLFFGAGIDLSYNFNVNVEQLSKTYAVSDTLALNAAAPADGKPSVSINDFKSRFGLGYMFNAGYRLSPAMSIDLRMTQTFWDNASGAGAQKVSNDFFKKPAMQISIGYRFGQGR